MKVEQAYFLLGVGGMSASFTFLLLGIYGAVANLPDAGLAGALCSIAFFVPGAVFLYYWQRSTRLSKSLSELVEVLKGYREVTMADLATRIDATPEQTELLVAACIGRGLVEGRIDAKEKTFTLAATQEEESEGREPP